MPRVRRAAVVAVGVGATAIGVAERRRRSRYLPGRAPVRSDAVTPEASRPVAAELLAMRSIRRRDEALTFAPTTVASVEILLHGRRYFPRILEDIAAAQDHVHLLFYAFRPGTIADAFADALAERAAAGLEVKVAVDSIGSMVDSTSRGLFERLRAAGAEIVSNDGLLVLRRGRIGDRKLEVHGEDAFHFDHRKMMVIDGRVAYVGGTGIEDHFADGRFADAMCRVTGPLVSQLQLAFLTSWVKDGGPRPPDLDGLFLDPVPGAAEPVEGLQATLMMNVPGTGHHPIRDEIFRGLDEARERVDVVNPYLANASVIRGLIAAAERGAQVRAVIPEKPQPPYAIAAFRGWLPELFAAGVIVVRHPGMAHAKIYRFDDRLIIGSCNLDDLSLYRNDELSVRFEGPAVPALADGVFDELVAASEPATISPGWATRAWERVLRRSSRFL
ncbi:MAG TPA: phosphatidylserine/phosphatidylglycerophosphate/cardiolipin synthase family protein [Candidatus Limnocylindrales bacterium]